MTRITRAARGLAGWAARLLFGAGFAVGGIGVYIALFASLGQRDPGHDWLLGVEIMGVGFVASVVGCVAVSAQPDRPRGLPVSDSAGGWYWGPYCVFLFTGIALLLLSCGLRSIGDWERSNVTAVGTFSHCTTQSDDNGTSYTCTYDWDWNGVHHTVTDSANGQYADGTPVLLWLDPVTGRPDDHDAVPIVFAFIGAGLFGLVDLIIYVAVAGELYKRRRNFPGWLADMAWWRPVAQPAKAPPAPAPDPVIEDAIPADSIPAALIEDARPPGY